MDKPAHPSWSFNLVVATLALCGSLIVVTSGPDSVQGFTPAVDAAQASPVGSVAASSAVPSDDVPGVLWDVLEGLDYMTGDVSAELQPFLGREVKIPGFMVPLEDWAEEVSEFLLVPYVGACVHTPPPPPNQLVHVQMNDGAKEAVSFWEPIWIRGTLEIEETTNIYGSVSFKLSGIEVTPYEG